MKINPEVQCAANVFNGLFHFPYLDLFPLLNPHESISIRCAELKKSQGVILPVDK